jgi:hypothetical protein
MKEDEEDAACGLYVELATTDMHTLFWWGNLNEKRHLEDTGTDVRIIWKFLLKKWDGRH